MTDWLISNADIINEGRRFHGDVRIKNGRIEAIGSGLAARAGEQVFDAAGRLLMPGMIDDQVHFREPGLEHKGDLATESRAAVAGGITSFMEMPNTKPPAITLDALEDKFHRASTRALANYSFYLGTTNDNLDVLRSLDPRAAAGIKVFMGASTGNMLVDNPDTLDKIFRDAPTILLTHCEDTPMIEANLAIERARYGTAIPVERHPYIRSREACLKSSRLAIELARRHGSRLHVLHISTAEELLQFEPGPIAGKRTTCSSTKPITPRAAISSSAIQRSSPPAIASPLFKPCAKVGSTYWPPIMRRIRWKKNRSLTRPHRAVCRSCSSHCSARWSAGSTASCRSS